MGQPFHEAATVTLERLHSLLMCCLAARNLKMIQCIPPQILLITGKAGDVINDQLCIVDQSQPTRSSIAEELIAEATLYSRNDFW